MKWPQFKQKGFKHAAIAYPKSYETEDTFTCIWCTWCHFKNPLPFKVDFFSSEMRLIFFQTDSDESTAVPKTSEEGGDCNVQHIMPDHLYPVQVNDQNLHTGNYQPKGEKADTSSLAFWSSFRFQSRFWLHFLGCALVSDKPLWQIYWFTWQTMPF